MCTYMCMYTQILFMEYLFTGGRRAVCWCWLWYNCEKCEVPKYYWGWWPSNWDWVRKPSPLWLEYHKEIRKKGSPSVWSYITHSTSNYTIAEVKWPPLESHISVLHFMEEFGIKIAELYTEVVIFLNALDLGQGSVLLGQWAEWVGAHAQKEDVPTKIHLRRAWWECNSQCSCSSGISRGLPGPEYRNLSQSPHSR